MQKLQDGSGNAALQVKAEQNDCPLNRLQIAGIMHLRLLLQNIKCLFGVCHRWDINVLTPNPTKTVFYGILLALFSEVAAALLYWCPLGL